MKTILIFAFALIAVASTQGGSFFHSKNEVHVTEFGLPPLNLSKPWPDNIDARHELNPYKRLLRIRSINSQQMCVEGTPPGECHDVIYVTSDSDDNAQPDDEEPPQREKRESDQPLACVPNQRWKQDCNWCTCSDDGRTAMCTIMACLPDYLLSTTPKPIPAA